MEAYFNDATSTLSFPFRTPKVLDLSFLNFLLREAVRRVKLGTNHLKTS